MRPVFVDTVAAGPGFRFFNCDSCNYVERKQLKMKCDGQWPDGGIACVYVTRAATPLLVPRSVLIQQSLQSNPSGTSGAAAEAVVGCFEVTVRLWVHVA